MTALDWYIVFVIGFALFALWVVYQAEAAIKRIRRKASDDASRERADVCHRADDKEVE